jgi:hypothetical protein
MQVGLHFKKTGLKVSETRDVCEAMLFEFRRDYFNAKGRAAG